MRVRKLSALFGAALIFGGCVILYLIMDVSLFPTEVREENNKWLHFGSRLDQTEENHNKQQTAIREIKNANNHVMVPEKKHTVEKYASHNFDLDTCSLLMDAVPSSDIQMLDVYKELKFDNLDGGVWKQGWNLEYETIQWTDTNKLKVFVIPHSHNDPGWIKTFEEYYGTQTRNILNNMVVKLKEDVRRKFIWAEISYFALWWDEIKSDVKEDVKKLVANGQLEIVAGGWVMPDEANSHYFALINQLLEGHQWLATHLGFKPVSSWAIDPFGHSPTMPFIMNRAGLKNLLIQRTHYSVKKHLAREKGLEFRWRQLWDGSGSTDLLSHMMPFYSYDVPHTCGPDPKVCCQFDFRRLPGYGMSCPWKVSPQVITNKNVAYRGELLLDQYRKKSQLYRTNVVLAPLGDDFRYDQASEWDAQYNNYQKIFDYLNGNPNLHVEIQFGTLSDFFAAVRSEMQPESFPTLTGDFFTYADRDDHYWSGYFTSRPFHKRMDRVLIGYLKAAETIFSLAWGSKAHSDWLLGAEWGLTKLLSDARQSLGLFQHHDGVTGTARDHVMEDYARKMTEAIKGTQHVIQQCAHFILTPSQSSYDPMPEGVFFDLDDLRKRHNSLPEKTTLNLGEGLESRKVVLYNPQAHRRQELVTLRVSMPQVKVVTASGSPVPSQTSPVFLHSTAAASTTSFDLSFVADVAALGLATYFVQASTPEEHRITNTLSNVRVMNWLGDAPAIEGFQVEHVEEPTDFSLSNKHLSITFTKHGLLKAVRLIKEAVVYPVHLDFAKYSARPGNERSGAYLFLPDGEADTVPVDAPLVIAVDGPLYSYAKVYLANVQHSIALYNTPGGDSLGIEIQNLVDIRAESNYELVMRLSSNLKNGDEFFTDLNGLQMVRRKRFPKLPLQANYYPLPKMAYIEDGVSRLTLITGQPQGVAALKEGQIEIMQDRRLNQDDNRGLGQGVVDNLPTTVTYRLLVERKLQNCQGSADGHPAGAPSLAAHLASDSLLFPLLRLIWSGDSPDELDAAFTPVAAEPGHDVDVLLLRAFPESTSVAAGFILHKQHVDACYEPRMPHKLHGGTVNVSDIFPTQFGPTMTRSSLTFIHNDGPTVKKTERQTLCANDMNAYTFPR